MTAETIGAPIKRPETGWALIGGLFAEFAFMLIARVGELTDETLNQSMNERLGPPRLTERLDRSANRTLRLKTAVKLADERPAAYWVAKGSSAREIIRRPENAAILAELRALVLDPTHDDTDPTP